MRICSLAPSGTEILCALGLADALVGVSHECDSPPEVLAKPRMLQTLLDHDHLSSEGIDRAVHAALDHHQPLYRVDEDALRQARPDLIVTQQLCRVCAVDLSQISEAIQALSYRPRVVALHPHTLDETLEDIRVIGEVTSRHAQAERLVQSCRDRIQRVQALLADMFRRPRVFCLEWIEPPMACGHWVPDMVELAGGKAVLGRAGEASRYVSVEEIIAARPEVLMLMPCGFSMARARAELPRLTNQPWWDELPAIREGRVYLMDGPAYFNRSGPRLIDGIERLAARLHPERCATLVPSSERAGVTL